MCVHDVLAVSSNVGSTVRGIPIAMTFNYRNILVFGEFLILVY